MEKIIRVMLVEDDPFWCQQLSADLDKEEDIQVVYVASTKEQALSAVELISIDVILMDINLTANHLDGLEVTKEILLTKGNLKVIMLTSLSENEIIVKAFQNGAINYITKSNYEDIIHAIREAYYEKASIHPDAAAAMRQEVKLMLLSPMEREIFNLRQNGYSRTQMSELLNKSVNTIKSQLRSIRNKLLK